MVPVKRFWWVEWTDCLPDSSVQTIHDHGEFDRSERPRHLEKQNREMYIKDVYKGCRKTFSKESAV